MKDKELKRKRVVNARLIVSQLLLEEQALWENYQQKMNVLIEHQVMADMEAIKEAKYKWRAIKDFLTRLDINHETITPNVD